MFPLKASRAGFILALIISISGSESFCTTSCISHHHNHDSTMVSFSGSSSTRIHRHRSLVAPLHSSIDTPTRPIEEEREKDRDPNKDPKEWKKVVGGFVPTFLKRSNDERSALDTKVQLIDTIQDYKKEVVDEQERIVVVRFFATFCKSCKASHPHFKKLVSQHSPNVKFVEVPLTKETAYIHEGLGVPSVPFGHIYHPSAGLVEEMKINKRVFGKFRDALDSYVKGSCDLSLEDDVEIETESKNNADEFQ